MNDPGSLQNLNDIILPGGVALWPPAPGWYFVLTGLIVLVLWLVFRALKSWRKNTYRRQALRELAAIERRGNTAAGEIPVLLKRTALSAWPREGVAWLSGAGWLAFLDRTDPGRRFSGEVAAMLDCLSYGTTAGWRPSDAEFKRLCGDSRHWLKHHRVDPA